MKTIFLILGLSSFLFVLPFGFEDSFSQTPKIDNWKNYGIIIDGINYEIPYEITNGTLKTIYFVQKDYSQNIHIEFESFDDGLFQIQFPKSLSNPYSTHCTKLSYDPWSLNDSISDIETLTSRTVSMPFTKDQSSIVLEYFPLQVMTDYAHSLANCHRVVVPWFQQVAIDWANQEQNSRAGKLSTQMRNLVELGIISGPINNYGFSSDIVSIPEWVSQIIFWWDEEKITKQDFLNVVEYLIQKNIVKFNSSIDDAQEEFHYREGQYKNANLQGDFSRIGDVKVDHLNRIIVID